MRLNYLSLGFYRTPSNVDEELEDAGLTFDDAGLLTAYADDDETQQIEVRD